MSIIKKFDKGIFSIHDKCKTHRIGVNIVTILVGVLIFVYYIPFIPISATPAFMLENEHIWFNFYGKINPFTTGAYILGLFVLYQYIVYDSLIFKILISIFYVMIIDVSLVVIMGMREWWELYIYLPHVIIVSLCVLVTYRKWKRKKLNLSLSQ